ncbi:hypothetical protein NDU88_011214 [Pleurodeles waltl]|uniref:Uncharacterized protein n=1 Tax=Pleurodeles waltl TaxID=8319 RepID=A0AAV7R2R3_PLEWA|nr:hypothetical protein NDU88_011214 [Pleurodeles waltl]
MAAGRTATGLDREGPTRGRSCVFRGRSRSSRWNVTETTNNALHAPALRVSTAALIIGTSCLFFLCPLRPQPKGTDSGDGPDGAAGTPQQRQTGSLYPRRPPNVHGVLISMSEIWRLLAHALKIKMLSKPTRNLGEKTEGVKVTRVGRGKGELTGANKRLTAIIAKPAVESMESMPELEDNHREARGKELGPSTENKQLQAQQYEWSERLEHQGGEGGASILGPATEGENLHKILTDTKNLGKITGKDPQSVEWGKDNSDRFYSLTEETDLSSGDHSLGGSEDSETLETEDKTSSNEPTVRQLR